MTQEFRIAMLRLCQARHMLFSLAHWLHLTGRAGLVLILDVSRFMATRRPAELDGTLYYSTAAVLDGYEVLRQFVDVTDELEHGLIAVVAPMVAVLSKDQNPRAVEVYPALRFRIADEVRDRNRVNPLASLVRVGHPSATGTSVVAGGQR